VPNLIDENQINAAVCKFAERGKTLLEEPTQGGFAEAKA
jgi:hypothetical protein